MKRTDEEIDKLFQDAAGKVEVPYQDSYWTEMEALLPKKSKKKGFWWIFGILFALVGITGTVFLFSANDAILENSAQANLGYVESRDADQKQSIDSNQELTDDAKDQKTLKDESGTSSGNLNSSTSSADFNRAPATILSDGEGLIKSENKNLKRENNKQQELNRENANSNLMGKQSKHNKQAHNINQHQNLKQVEKQVEKQDKVTFSSGKNANENITEKKGEFADAKNQSDLALQETKENTALEEKAALPEIVKDTLSDDKIDLKSTEVNPAKTAGDADLKKQIKQPAPASTYYVQFGGRFGQSYLNTTTDKMMAGITLGVGYQYVRPGIGYAVGLHVTSSFVRNMEIIRKSRVYGFGVTNYEQNLKYKQLTYLEVPISINYVHLKNTFTIGVAPTYLVSTMMNFSERQELEVINERNYYGQKIGLKTLGMETMIGYQRLIKNNWSVGVNLGVTLFQQIEDNNFENRAVAFPLHGQLILRKSLIFKK